MPQAPGRPIVLVVDEDLGFVCWIGEALAEIGYETLPALNSRQALSSIKKLSRPIDAVIFNPDLPGAAAMIRTLGSSRVPPRKVVVIGNPPAEGEGPVQADASLSGQPPSTQPHDRSGSRSCEAS